MKPTIPALYLTAVSSGALAGDAGLAISEIYMPHHEAAARVAIWYPASEPETNPSRYAENMIFQGVDAFLDAEIADGRHPIVLFSHGMGGTDRAQAWLRSLLARNGAVVVMVNHPNSTWGDLDMAAGVEHWTRAQDMSAALDALLGDPQYARHIDQTRIMASGFSYGGWTALSLGGMTGNLDGFVEACIAYGESMEACDMFLSERVGLQNQDRDAWNANYADARVTQVVAIDPGFVWGLESRNASGLLPDTVLIGLGDAETRMMATDFDRSGLADMLPEAHLRHLEPAFHFTAMPECTSSGPEILAAEGDDPVCTDPQGTDRAKIHQEIIEVILAALDF